MPTRLDDRASALHTAYGQGAVADQSRQWAIDLITTRHPTEPMPSTAQDAWAVLFALDGFPTDTAGWLKNEGAMGASLADLWSAYWASKA